MSSLRNNIEAFLCRPEQEMFPIEDWQYDVDNGDTKRGFDDWLASLAEQEADGIIEKIAALIHIAPGAFSEGADQTAFNQLVRDAFATFRMMESGTAAQARRYLGEDHDEFTYGETGGTLPGELRQDLERLADLGMAAFECAGDASEIHKHIAAMADSYDLAGEDVERSRAYISQPAPGL